MGHGGARPGAGRKPGSPTKKTREIADRAAAAGITPLEVMLGAMRDLWTAGRKSEAASIAKDAAPFVHARLAALDVSMQSDNTIRVVSDKPIEADAWERQFTEDQDHLAAPAGTTGSSSRLPPH